MSPSHLKPHGHLKRLAKSLLNSSTGLISVSSVSPQIMYAQPTEPQEDYTPRPKDPSVLLGPPLYHPDRLPTHAQSVRYIIKPPLCPLQDFFLLP